MIERGYENQIWLAIDLTLADQAPHINFWNQSKWYLASTRGTILSWSYAILWRMILSTNFFSERLIMLENSYLRPPTCSTLKCSRHQSNLYAERQEHYHGKQCRTTHTQLFPPRTPSSPKYFPWTNGWQGNVFVMHQENPSLTTRNSWKFPSWPGTNQVKVEVKYLHSRWSLFTRKEL